MMTSARHSFATASRGAKPDAVALPVAARNGISTPRHKTTRDCPRVTVRFSRDDYERLQELADGASLAVYLRAKALDQKLPRGRKASGTAIADRAAVAQLLGLLGQSRIANNLNQLAYHANIGSLAIDDQTREQIEDAYAHVRLMRSLLMQALGLKG